MNYYRHSLGHNRSYAPTFGVPTHGQAGSEHRAAANWHPTTVWNTEWPVPRLWQLTARAAALRFVTVTPDDTVATR
jgi:hypothetical protein